MSSISREERVGLIALLRSRQSEEFDGECHLTNEEADRLIAALSPDERLIEALREAMLSRLREGPGDYNKGFDNGVRAAVAMFDAQLSTTKAERT